MSVRQDWIAARGGPLRGELLVPGDKSVSHRAIMFGAIAEGSTRIDGFLEGEDTRATAAIFRQLGVRIEAPSDGVRIVHGVGLHGLQPTGEALDCGNAGTAMRLLTGLLAGQRFDSTLVGDESLSKRPMRRVIEPLSSMGARIDSNDGAAPLQVHGGRALHGIDYALPVASAQIKSAVLLAGLLIVAKNDLAHQFLTHAFAEREVRKIYEEKVDEPLKQAYAKIANARFAIEGTSGSGTTVTVRIPLYGLGE